MRLDHVRSRVNIIERAERSRDGAGSGGRDAILGRLRTGRRRRRDPAPRLSVAVDRTHCARRVDSFGAGAMSRDEAP